MRGFRPTNNEGLGCDDTLFCTTGETCCTGRCDATAAPRSTARAPATSAMSGCATRRSTSARPSPTNEGLGCDDTLFCTTGETCSSGVCDGGTAIDCSGSGDQCNTGVCNETLDQLRPSPTNEGLGCDDTLFCTTGETCSFRVPCDGGSAIDCSGSGDQCNVGVCNETLDSCEASPTNEGLGCDDTLFCTTGETCSFRHACDGGTAIDCSGSGDQCNTGVCNEGTLDQQCEAVAHQRRSRLRRHAVLHHR